MAVTDYLPRAVQQRCSGIATNVDRAADLMIARSCDLSDLPTPAGPELEGRSPSHRPDPTGSKLAAAEKTMEGHLDRLATVTSRCVSLAQSEFERELTTPLHWWTLLLDDEQRLPISDRRWRTMVRGVVTLVHEATTEIHEGWRELWDSRWDDTGGMTVLNVEVELRARQLGGAGDEGAIHRTVVLSRKLARNLEPARPAAQKDLVWCRHHPDKLAGKYRSLELCDACYARQQRAS